jgi:RNA ligase (TIGR02306 family)
MSKLEVKVTKVKIVEHPNADRLEIACTDYDEQGFHCIVGLNQFQDGDLAIYIPSDSLLPDPIMEYLAKTKINMSSNRLRAIKIRGVVSEGLCLSFQDLEAMGYGKYNYDKSNKTHYLISKDTDKEEFRILDEGTDLTSFLEIKKYEPPVRYFSLRGQGTGTLPSRQRDDFPKYTDIERIEKSPRIFDGEDVVATVKVHGTNFRCGYLEKEDLTFWQKLKKKLLKKEYREFLVGTHFTIRKKADPVNDPWFKTKKKCVYWETARKYKLKNFCKYLSKWGRDALNQEYELAPVNAPVDAVVYGETYGPCAHQKGYTYGEKDIAFRVFDIKLDGKFLDFKDVHFFCVVKGIPCVETVYEGPYDSDVVLPLAEAVDTYGDWKGNREGIVIRTLEEKWKPQGGRCIKKKINSAYLLDKTNTEYH